MQIYKYYTSNKELVEYTSDDVLEDKPCYILGCGLFYPLKVKEYRDFINKYASYFTLSEEGLDKQFPMVKGYDNFLDKVIGYNSFIKLVTMENEVNTDEAKTKAVEVVIDEFEKAFSIVTRKQIKYNYNKKSFHDETNKVSINKRNFDDVRNVIAMQNLIKEPIFYEDKEYAEIMMEARQQKIKRDGGSINLSEMVAYSKVYNKLKYNEIYEQNILQLYADNFCMGQLESYNTAMRFKTVSNDVPDVHLVQAFIDDLYKPNDDSDLLKDFDGFDGKSL